MDESFIGLAMLREQHAQQVATFERWAAACDWYAFHENHYDWWAYPVNRRSGYGDRYKLTPEAVEALQHDGAFLTLWRRGVALGCLAWGWSLAEGRYIDHPQAGQAWANWPVRLYKMAVSARVLNQPAVVDQLRTLAEDLRAKGEVFMYDGRDLNWAFERMA